MGSENKKLPEENLDDIMTALGRDEEEEPKKAWSFSEINDLLGDEEPEDEFFDAAPRYTAGENEFANDFEEELDFEDEFDTEASPFELSADQTTLMPEDRPAPVVEEEPLDAGIALGAPAEEFAAPFEEEPADDEPEAEEEPAVEEEPVAEEELVDEEPVPEEPAAEEPPVMEDAPVEEFPVDEPTMSFETVEAPPLPEEAPEEEDEPAFAPSPEDDFQDEEPTRPLPDLNNLTSSADDEPDYVPGIVKDDVEPEESDEDGEKDEKVSLRDRFRRMRNSFVRVVEGGEQDDEFAEEDLVDTVKDITREEEPELPKRAGMFGGRKGRKGGKEPGVRSTDELYKGLDENPQSPKMIMELADEKPELSREEKRALADKTVGIHPFFNESIEHQIRKVKTENVSAAEPVLEGEGPTAVDLETAAGVVEGESQFKEAKT
ncbi:MAG: hypothetical protein IIZ60_08815, partial [Clostridia bacterium]|nr:hypothetical protein [Clostridia bacterium]